MERGATTVVSIVRQLQAVAKGSATATEPPATPASGLLTASNVVRKSGRDVWPVGTDDAEANLIGLVPMPTKLANGRRWQIERIAPRGEVNDLAWSPDGAMLAVGSSDGHVRVYRLVGDDLQLVRCFSSPRQQYVETVAWSRDSQWICIETSEWGSEVLLFDVKTGHRGPALWLPHPDHRVAQICFHPTKAEVLICLPHRVYKWPVDFSSTDEFDLLNAEKLPFPRHEKRYTCGTWSPDGSQIIIGRADGVMLVTDANGDGISEFAATETPNPNYGLPGDRLRWNSENELVWNLPNRVVFANPMTEHVNSTITGATSALYDKTTRAHISVHNANDANHRYARIRVTDEAGKESFREFLGQTTGVISNWRSGGSMFATGTDGQIQLWKWRDGRLRRAAELGTFGNTNLVAISNDGKKVAINKPYGATAIWGIDGTSAERCPTRGRISSMEWNHDDNELSVAGHKGAGTKNFRIDGSSVTRISGDNYFYRIAPNGKLWAQSDDEGAVLVNSRTGDRSVLSLAAPQKFYDLKFSSESAYAAVRTYRSVWHIFDLSDLSLIEFDRDRRMCGRDFDWQDESASFVVSGASEVICGDAEKRTVSWVASSRNGESTVNFEVHREMWCAVFLFFFRRIEKVDKSVLM